MERITITVNKRDGKGKGFAKRLRNEGAVPAVVYSTGMNVSLSVPLASLKILHSIRFSESAIITMKIADSENEKPFPVLIKDMQYNPLNEAITHIDFLKVSLKEKIKVRIPITLKGEARGVKDEGGVLTQILRELEVEGLPLDLPEQVVIDVSDLAVGHSIHVQDIKLSANVRIATDVHETVVTLGAKEEEPEEVAVLDEQGPQEPEVIKEKKDKEPAEGQAQEAKEGKKDTKESKKEGK